MTSTYKYNYLYIKGEFLDRSISVNLFKLIATESSTTSIHIFPSFTLDEVTSEADVGSLWGWPSAFLALSNALPSSEMNSRHDSAIALFNFKNIAVIFPMFNFTPITVNVICRWHYTNTRLHKLITFVNISCSCNGSLRARRLEQI